MSQNDIVCKEPKYKHWREYHKYHLAVFEDGKTEKILKKIKEIENEHKK